MSIIGGIAIAVLMIGATEHERIAVIKAHAKAHPVPLSLIRRGRVDDTDVLELKVRKPGLVRPPSQHVMFPGGYHAAFSVEEQPIGFCSHLSVSVEGVPARV